VTFCIIKGVKNRLQKKIMKRDMLRIEVTHGTGGREAVFCDSQDPPMEECAEKKDWEHG
jgi:hypothetical protein